MQTFAHDLLSGLKGARTALIADESGQLPALEKVITGLEKAEEGDDLGAFQDAAVQVVRDLLPAPAKAASPPAAAKAG